MWILNFLMFYVGPLPGVFQNILLSGVYCPEHITLYRGLAIYTEVTFVNGTIVEAGALSYRFVQNFAHNPGGGDINGKYGK